MGLFYTSSAEIKDMLSNPDSKYYDYGYGTGGDFYKDTLTAPATYGSGFGEMTRAQQQAQALGAYATGEQSAARDLSADQLARQKLAFQSAAATAERGGYNPSARREAAFAQAQGGQDIAGQQQIAEQLERQQAARAYMGQSAQVLQGQLAGQSLSRGYASQNIRDKGALWGARGQSDANRMERERLRAANKVAEDARARNFILSTAGSAAKAGTGIAKLSGGGK